MKTLFIALCLFLSFPVFCIAQNNQGTKVVLSTEELEEFKNQAIKTVEDLGGYITVMVDKSNDMDRRNRNMELARNLFADPDSNIVEVTSVKDPSKKSYKSIGKYLIAVRDLPYQSVEITWSGIYLSSDFEKKEDGKYYGVASICQTFTAKNRGVDGKLYVVSQDETCKKIQIIVEQLQCMDGLKEKKCWILKLGDIKVDAHK